MKKKNIERIRTKSNSGFGIKDYINMFKYDIKAPFIYFFERHIFDLFNNTDTHKRLLIKDYEESVQDVNHSFNHSCSWTSVINFSLNFVSNYLGNESIKYSFFDVGCGKGKVLLVATKGKLCNQFMDFYGVEINRELVNIANQNFTKMNLPTCKIISKSARNLNLGKVNKKMIIYLYNPFDSALLESFLRSQSYESCIIIYNNPQFSDLIIKSGFNEIMNKNHKMTNGRIKIFENIKGRIKKN